MAKLQEKIKLALDETRILILGTQVLLGLEFRSAFEQRFDSLPESSRYLRLGVLGLMLVTLALLMAPGAYHRIVAEGEDSEDVHRFTTTVMDWALPPFATGLAVDLFVTTKMVAGDWTGLALAAALLILAAFLWYGVPTLHHRGAQPGSHANRMGGEEAGPEKLDLFQKIDQVLTECRVVLPGAQALLGFQFITVLAESFDRLPTSSKYFHLASLAAVALSILFLMTPAAYHRLAEQGEETEYFHRFAGRMLIASMVPLAVGIAGDVFVVFRKVTGATIPALIVAAVLMVGFYGLWFGYALYVRRHRGAISTSS
jgi:hypothetical protein